MAKKFNIINEAGKLIDEDKSFMNRAFIEKNFGKIVCVIILLLTYIQMRYEYEDRILNIGDLKRELADIRYTSVEDWGRLAKEARPETIREKVRTRNVELKECDAPPVRIK